MRQKLILLAMVAAVAALGATSLAVADSPFEKAAHQQLSPGACDPRGQLVIDVSEKVRNDADSGQQSNSVQYGWALDNYERHIKVWKTQTVNTYCATVEYDGNFTTVAGLAPGPTGTVGAGIKGEMEGGRRATIVGTLLAAPAWRTHGSVGTIDYNCSTETGDCPGYVSWVGQYFAVTSYNDDWWGWIYHTGRNGTWINSADGNSGNIVGVAGHADDD